MSKFLYIAVCLLLVFSVFGVKKIAELKGENALLESRLQTERENATQNWTVFERIKSDLNSSLNSCYADYKKLSDSFDRYRVVVGARTLRSNGREASYCSARPSPYENNKPANGRAEQQLPQEASLRRIPAPTITTCTIGGSNAIVDALNAID